MRDAWLRLRLLLIVSVVPVACGQAFQLSGGTSTGTSSGASGDGGASSTTVGATGGAATSGGGTDATTATTTTTTSTGSGGKPCITVADCQGVNTLCGEFVCKQGSCALHVLQPDGVSVSQLYGDCHVAKCLNGKLMLEASNADTYDDGNPCTKDTCDGAMPSNTIKMGSPCGPSGVCNDKGACVECLDDNICMSNGNKYCVGNYCSPSSCKNGGVVPDGNETDVDCGGDECAPCIPTKTCKVASDCMSHVCEDPFVGSPIKTCKAPTCGDGIQNGTETDVDCGGNACPAMNKCDFGKHCSVAGDCKSGVCQAGACKAPTCGDGVQNGQEMGIDCGGPGCVITKCPGG